MGRVAGMPILVTGGAGFLGSHLCERLLEDGQDVLSVDNYFTSSRRNVAHLLSHAGPVNIGNPSECSMLELAELMLGMVGGGSKLEFHPLPQDNPRQRQPVITLAKEALGWEPRVSIEDGLKETLAYFRKLLNA
jgi:UDP-glucuronate decarboxylase